MTEIDLDNIETISESLNISEWEDWEFEKGKESFVDYLSKMREKFEKKKRPKRVLLFYSALFLFFEFIAVLFTFDGVNNFVKIISGQFVVPQDDQVYNILLSFNLSSNVAVTSLFFFKKTGVSATGGWIGIWCIFENLICKI